MRILNLTSLEKSEVKYHISSFPDGQRNVDIEPEIEVWFSDDRTKQENLFYSEHISENSVQIKSRFNNFLDYEIIACAVASLKELGCEHIHLYIPYFLGARSDRKFKEGGNNYVKHVVAPLINRLRLESVTILDPHSDVIEACINSIRIIDNHDLVKWALTEIYGESYKNDIYKFVLVSPDGGSLKKIQKIVEEFKIPLLINCMKHRDTDGKIIHTEVPDIDIYLDKDFIIVDDICDGGRTFIEIARIIKERANFTGKIYLIVTHGIFSAGLIELTRYFDGIYCTNSYKQLSGFAAIVKQFKVL